MEQFNSLHGEIAEFSEDHPMYIDISIDVKTGDQVLKVVDPPQFPPRWGVLVSEMVGNCTKALNYLVVALIRKADGQPDRNVAFPISLTEDEYLKVGRGGKTYRDRLLHGIPEPIRKEIDRLQPWQHPTPAETLLAVLKALRDAAEHRDLQAAYLKIETPAYFVWVPTAREDYRSLTIELPVAGGINVQAQFKNPPSNRIAGMLVTPKVQVGNALGTEPVFGSKPLELVALTDIQGVIQWTAVVVERFAPGLET